MSCVICGVSVIYICLIYTYIYWYAKTTIFETKLLTAQYALRINECIHYQWVRMG